MSDTEEILYRENPNKNFEKFIYIGTAYPEDMYNSPPGFDTRDDLKELVADDNYAEILFQLSFSLMIYSQSSKEFIDLFGKEVLKFYHKKAGEIENIVSNWLRSIDVPIFSGLDLREQRIKDSEFFSNGELRSIKFTDGSEVEVSNEDSGYSGGFYVEKKVYPKLLENFKNLREIISND